MLGMDGEELKIFFCLEIGPKGLASCILFDVYMPQVLYPLQWQNKLFGIDLSELHPVSTGHRP